MNISEALLFAPDKKDDSEVSPSKKAYRKLLADAMLGGRTCILSYSNQPQTPTMLTDSLSQVKYVRRRRYIPKV
jgi:hypothetical protein